MTNQFRIAIGLATSLMFATALAAASETSGGATHLSLSRWSRRREIP
jgi:hypothetical protein